MALRRSTATSLREDQQLASLDDPRPPPLPRSATAQANSCWSVASMTATGSYPQAGSRSVSSPDRASSGKSPRSPASASSAPGSPASTATPPTALPTLTTPSTNSSHSAPRGPCRPPPPTNPVPTRSRPRPRLLPGSTPPTSPTSQRTRRYDYGSTMPPRSTTPTSTTAISRSPRRRVGLDRCIGRENANDLSVPAASSQDFAARIGQAWRIGHRGGAGLRPGTGPARAGGARANYWIQPAECPRFNAGNDAPRPPCCHPRGIPRHARSGPAAARDLMVAAAWVLLFVLITTFFPA